MKNRSSLFFVGGIIIFALIGISSVFLANPAGFLQRIALITFVGFAIYLIARLVTKANPQKKDQRAFLKAAKKSKKRLQQKGGGVSHLKNSPQGTLTTLKKNTKKKSLAQLTVIDGKKGKKKNRASF